MNDKILIGCQDYAFYRIVNDDNGNFCLKRTPEYCANYPFSGIDWHALPSIETTLSVIGVTGWIEKYELIALSNLSAARKLYFDTEEV